jgi:hypothetical protein
MKSAALAIAILGLVRPPLLHAQSLAGVAKATEAERASTKTEKAEPSKVYTNKDLPPSASAGAEVPATPPSAAIQDDPARQAALAALRATQSVVAGGGNTSEFKAYYLAAKVKVDALPAIPENAALRDVVGLYADATSLLVAGQIQRMSGTEVRYFKDKYLRESRVPFWRTFQDVPDKGFARTGFIGEMSAAHCHDAGSLLLVLAGRTLAAVP